MNGNSVRGLYTVVEAAQLVGVGRSTMYELVSRGEVASIRVGRKVLIRRSTLEALLGFTPATPAELAEIQAKPVVVTVPDSSTPAAQAAVVRPLR
jgi:excisionase family DNA binding protein